MLWNEMGALQAARLCEAAAPSLTWALLPAASYAALVRTLVFACPRSFSSSSSLILGIGVISVLLLLCAHYFKDRFCACVPAYATVFGHIAVSFSIYAAKLRPVVNAGLGFSFLVSCFILLYLFVRVIISDPGNGSPSFLSAEEGMREEDQIHQETMTMIQRGKYCQICQAFIQRYDHHCAAVHNCIGRKNHLLFLCMLLAFIVAEVLYLSCCASYIKSCPLARTNKVENCYSSCILYVVALEALCKEPLVLTSGTFVGLQFLWQVPFLLFQLNLLVHNLTMDEWVHWEDYPKFNKQVASSVGESDYHKKFINPYNKGFLHNVDAMVRKWS